MPKNKSTEKLKYYLRGARYWRQKADYLSEKIMYLRSRAEKSTTTYSDVPMSGGFSDHRQAVMDEMMDKEKKYTEMVKKCNERIQEIQYLIDCLKKYEERAVCELYYIYGENWQDVALKLNYSQSAVFKIHGEALVHLLEIHKQIVDKSGKALF